MQIFVDSANPGEIELWLRQGVVDGVTTNPSIMLKDGVRDIEARARQLCELMVDRPVSTEDGSSCLDVVNTLTRENISVNCTALLSFNQAILAAKAGATYVSLFAGRIADEGGDADAVVGNVREWLDKWTYHSRIIVGSIRSAIDVQNAALAGAHVVTVPPQFLAKMVDHRYTRETVRQFNRDAESALIQMRQSQVA